MTFMLVDDHLNSHPKARRAGLEAMGLWVMAGSHVVLHLTDGIVPRWFVMTWPDGDVAAKRLVDEELWHAPGHDCPACPQPGDGEWIFHDWHEINRTRTDILTRRAERKAAGQRGGKASAQAKATARAQAGATATPQPVGGATGEALGQATPQAVTPANERTPKPKPRSTSVVVTLEELLTSAGDKVATTTTIEAWAAKNTPDVDLEAETAAFLAKNAGKTLHDPTAAWKAWMKAARPISERVTVPAGPARVTTVGLPPAADAPRCEVEGHEHELAGHCRICAADALEGPPDVDPEQEGTT